MKIAFWSPRPGQSGTTSNMLASAVMSSVIQNKNVLVLHNHFSDVSLEKSVLGKITAPDLFEDIGLDSLLRNIKISELSEGVIHNSVISLYKNRLHILPGTTKEYKGMFEAGLYAAIPAILNAMNKYYDLVFMDLAPGGGKLSGAMQEEADLIVVNLTQDKNMIDDYFAKYHLPKEKTVYLIGRYNGNSRYNLTNLERSYPCIRGKTGVIPYNIEFMDAVTEGKLINFTVKNLANGRGDDNLYFIKKVRQTVELLTGGRVKAGGQCEIKNISHPD